MPSHDMRNTTIGQNEHPPFHHVTDREIEKDLLASNYTRSSELMIQGPGDPIITPKAEYVIGHPGEGDQKGHARLHNWRIEDRLTNKELQDLLWIFKNSENLLFSQHLTAIEDSYKKRLLALLISINWNLQIPSQQVKFMKQMEERLQYLKINKQL